MAITVTFTRMIELYPSGLFLQWNIQDADQFGDYVVEIYRGQAPDGPWEKLAEYSNAYNYVDRFDTDGPADGAPNHFSIDRKLYYRVRVIPPTGLEEAVFAVGQVGVELQGRQRGVRRKMLRDELVTLSKLNGTPVALLKRKRWGPRCPDCYDPYTREVARGECLRCYGTGFVGGYHNPHYTWARRTPRSTNVTLAEAGKVERSPANIIMLDYPEMQVDDVVVFLQENTRYLITSTTGTELRLVRVHQEIQASELARSAVEYRIPVDPTTQPPMF